MGCNLDYAYIVSVIRDLALKAGNEIMKVYGSDDFGVDTKSDDSPVTRADRATFFIVDPLDGTKEFIKRRGEFTVNIALVENGVPTLGVVYAPAIGRLFYTDENGQTVEELGAHHVGQIKDMTGAGSSLKFCLVATGEADFYPRLGRTMEWDTAAGHAVVVGAGGQVLHFDTQVPLMYGKNGFENPFFVAMSPKVKLR